MNELTRPVTLIGTDPQSPPEGAAAVRVSTVERSAWAADAVGRLDEAAHVIAIGADAPGALTLAADSAQHVVSLILVDPQVDVHDVEHEAVMSRVTVPTLVIASAPTPDSPIDQPQSIAGGVDNGVFVIIDGAAAPTLVSRPASVLEWSAAFMSIAEGLAETRTDLIAVHQS